jgi:hypothetical protein
MYLTVTLVAERDDVPQLSDKRTTFMFVVRVVALQRIETFAGTTAPPIYPHPQPA